MGRLRRLQALNDLDLPIVLLVGGGTGTGKSTLATEIAHRLGITRTTSTDFIRQTMRALFSRELMPSVHYSSFEAALALTKAEEEELGDAALLGFLDQTRNVLAGVEAAIERALAEGWSMVLEVHALEHHRPALGQGPFDRRFHADEHVARLVEEPEQRGVARLLLLGLRQRRAPPRSSSSGRTASARARRAPAWSGG